MSHVGSIFVFFWCRIVDLPGGITSSLIFAFIRLISVILCLLLVHVGISQLCLDYFTCIRILL